MRKNNLSKLWLVSVLAVSTATMATGQNGVSEPKIAEMIFWTPNVIISPSSKQVDKGTREFSIQHGFGLLSGGEKTLFGLDDPANIRFGLDWGLKEWFSVGVGRSKYAKTYDVRAKARFRSNSQLMVNIFSNVGVETLSDGRSFTQRLSYFSGVILSRKLSEKLFVQMMPGWSHFNLVEKNELPGGVVEEEVNDHVVVGVSARYQLKRRASLLVDFLPALGARSDGSNNVMSVGVDLKTGGHVFQLFVLTSQWITPQHAISRSRRSISDRDFGFGFSIHRTFW